MKEYEITPRDGIPTTVLLSDEDAKARGLIPAEKAAKAPANKQATPANKARPAAASKSGDAG